MLTGRAGQNGQAELHCLWNPVGENVGSPKAMEREQKKKKKMSLIPSPLLLLLLLLLLSILSRGLIKGESARVREHSEIVLVSSLLELLF